MSKKHILKTRKLFLHFSNLQVSAPCSVGTFWHYSWKWSQVRSHFLNMLPTDMKVEQNNPKCIVYFLFRNPCPSQNHIVILLHLQRKETDLGKTWPEVKGKIRDTEILDYTWCHVWNRVKRTWSRDSSFQSLQWLLNSSVCLAVFALSNPSV